LAEENNNEISSTDHMSRISIAHQQLIGIIFPVNKKHQMEEEKHRNTDRESCKLDHILELGVLTEICKC